MSELPQFRDAPSVVVESLEQFLGAEAPRLESLLAEEEAWARASVAQYPPRPDAIAFRAAGASPAELRGRFIAAVRVNPNSRVPLFLQLQPGQVTVGAPLLAERDGAFASTESTRSSAYVALREGQRVLAIDVLATASDEPDYGLDIGVWSDSGTDFGQRYGFGKQPFGNLAVASSSQAPLHIGYYHEPALVYRAAPFLEKTYPEYRIHLWRSLAAYAFRTGHPYWGWRFAGWGLHYVQDLTQPYHARVLPGVGIARMLWTNALDLSGMHQAKSEAISLVTNRHFALENFQMHYLRAGFLQPGQPNAAIEALRDSSADAQRRYDDAAPRMQISRSAYEASDSIDHALEAAVPARVVSDASYVFGQTEPEIDLYAQLGATPAKKSALEQAMVPLMKNLGKYSRAYIAGISSEGKQ